MSNNKTPQVSIGLPVYNAGNYLKEALDSILAQTFTDFELIISDNASTDATEKICRDYASQDKRIRYIRNEKNLGGAANFNRVFELASGRYFKWVAHDDRIDREFLWKCVKVLDEDPAVGLCISKANRINEYGVIEGTYDFDIKIDSFLPHERFHGLICIRHNCIAVYGLMRAGILRKTPLIKAYAGSDRCLLGELGLRSRFYEIPEYLFFRRDHPGASLRANPDKYKSLSAWFDPKKTGKMNFPEWRLFLEIIKSVGTVTLSTEERLLCYCQVFKRFKLRWRMLLLGVIFNVKPILENSLLGKKLISTFKWINEAGKVNFWAWESKANR